ncbi:MAG: 50S ribosomal protein L29 [Chloroflexi bacterium]|nr:50S ribosomal protein L29 [Chloroflexota bacterium]
MKAKELRGLGPGELRKEEAATHRELLNLRFRWATRQLANPNEINKARKNLARIKTILSEKELGISP